MNRYVARSKNPATWPVYKSWKCPFSFWSNVFAHAFIKPCMTIILHSKFLRYDVISLTLKPNRAACSLTPVFKEAHDSLPLFSLGPEPSWHPSDRTTGTKPIMTSEIKAMSNNKQLEAHFWQFCECDCTTFYFLGISVRTLHDLSELKDILP